MHYLPHTPEEIHTMLEAVGMDSLEDLFAVIPQSCRRDKLPDLPKPMTESDLTKHMGGLAEKISSSPKYKVFIGAGSYNHFIPAVIGHLVSRSEFSTAYTPYQPEISQGTLQAIYEYQTLVSRLLGLDVANASLYDGASALAEALLMALRISKKKTVALSRAIHPHYREVVRTYLKPSAYQLVELPYRENGVTAIDAVKDIADVAAIAVQSPNFFGCIENMASLSDISKSHGALSVVTFTEPLAYGVLTSPGSLGIDIACGEGQSFGIPQSFGGPGLGMFACKKEYVRNMPGRLVGKTVDAHGQSGFVLTLATREQHIRREKATSNICTNSGLNALTAAMYMATMGGTGLRKLAMLNYDRAEYMKKAFKDARCSLPFTSPTFNEFVVKLPGDFKKKYQRCIDKYIVPGLPLARYYPELTDCILFCVTETLTAHDIDIFVSEVLQ